ncbi:MAG: hypothetical protein AAB638_03725 [Patescibacteria group bacterium]
MTQDEMVPAEKARDEADSLVTEARQLSSVGGLTPDRLFALQKRMKWLDRHAEQYGPNPRPGMAYFATVRSTELAGIRDSDQKFRNLDPQERKRYQDLFKTDPEFLAILNFTPSHTTSNGLEFTTRIVMRYFATIPLGVLAYMIIRFGQKRSFFSALGSVFNHPILMILYPFGVLWALVGFGEWEDYKRGMRRSVAFLSYATAASVSIFCGGTASAQSVKKEENKKSSGYSLQLDTRVIDPVEGPPILFSRATLNTTKWFFESITTMTPKTGAWSNEVGLGSKLIRGPRTTLVLMGIVSNDSTGTRKEMLGVQFFRPSPICSIMIPVVRVEKAEGGPIGFAFVANPFCKLGKEGVRSRVALVPDQQVRKTLGKPITWTSGLGVGVFPRKGKSDA